MPTGDGDLVDGHVCLSPGHQADEAGDAAVGLGSSPLTIGGDSKPVPETRQDGADQRRLEMVDILYLHEIN